MTRLIDKVLAQTEFELEPPICVDVGASGGLPNEWTRLAPYSICVAFDGDTREFCLSSSISSSWKKLHKLNRLVAERDESAADFYLTRSPYCSSTLEPDSIALANWAFADLFDVRETVSLPVVPLLSVLNELGIERIDWLKTDSQGTDLRLVSALPEHIINAITIADFEPGILDAYKGEDKLYDLMKFMDRRPFFVSDLDIKGSQRIHNELFNAFPGLKTRFLSEMLKTSPGWAEISYIHDLSGVLSRRKILLNWVFSTIKNQHGHALLAASRGRDLYGDDIFKEMCAHSLSKIRVKLPYALSMVVARRIKGLIERGRL